MGALPILSIISCTDTSSYTPFLVMKSIPSRRAFFTNLASIEPPRTSPHAQITQSSMFSPPAPIAGPISWIISSLASCAPGRCLGRPPNSKYWLPPDRFLLCLTSRMRMTSIMPSSASAPTDPGTCTPFPHPLLGALLDRPCEVLVNFVPCVNRCTAHLWETILPHSMRTKRKARAVHAKARHACCQPFSLADIRLART